ncbi:hypothetical protein INT47_005193 [Mucor saturninus]|uniref:Peroxin-3 n=1 Tax=Mucor saturninus TaxID=64648 RepID=A0A8H7QVU9_9FUNG|nr:hypothetical protein INT47_005193 [Mucor saturninus]
MTIYTSLKDYVKRHRNGLLITATIAGGSYFAGKYATSKIKSISEKSTAERLAKENLKRRFQQNQNDCVFTVLSLLPTLGDQILHEMNIEEGWAKLQETRRLEKIETRLRKEREMAASAREEQEAQTKEVSESVVMVDHQDEEHKGDKEQKHGENSTGLDASVNSLSTSFVAEQDHPLPAGILTKKEKNLLWDEIKTMSRFTYIWSVSVLNKSEPTIRLQQEGAEPDVGFLDPHIERMFLSASWWLLHRGWKAIAERVSEAVNEIVSEYVNIPIKGFLDYQDAEKLVSKLRKRIEFDQDGQPISYRQYMLPDTREEELEFLRGAGFEDYPEDETSTISLKKLLDETRDFIDSPDFHPVLSSCLDEVFAIFDHHAFGKTLLHEPMTSGIQEITNAEALHLEQGKKVILANLLPTISRQAHLIIAGNEYLNAFAYIKELQAFSALIYTQYGDEPNSA